MSTTEDVLEIKQRQEKLKEIVKQMMQPLHVIAPLAVIATAYAYFLGWSYFYGLFSTAGVEWIMRDMNALETMTAPLFLLTIAAAVSLLMFGWYFEGSIKVRSLIRLFVFLCATAAVCGLIHGVVEYWWGHRFESHWKIGAYLCIVFSLTLIPTVMIGNSVEGNMPVSAQMSFLYLNVGLLLLPFLARAAGEVVANNQVFREESSLSRVKLASSPGCKWRLFRTLSNGDYLLVLPRDDKQLKPNFKIVKTEDIVRIMDSSIKKCGSP